MRKNKGVTLVALVVTIIVLLILAGISVWTALKENGVVQETDQAKEITTKASWIEEISEKILLKETSSSTAGLSETELIDILSGYGTLSEEENVLDRTLTIADGTQIKVYEIYIGKLKTENETDFDDVTLNALLIENSGTARIDVETIIDYTGDKNLEELYYSYYIKHENDEAYKLAITEQNLTNYSFDITENGKYIVMVEISEDENIAEVVGVKKSPEIVKTNTYTVNFYAEDKSTILQTLTVVEGEDVMFTGTAPTKSGYTFQYWVENGQTTEASLENITKDLNLYPYFVKNATSCFVAGTKVLTENGLVNIEDVQTGTKIYSFNEKTNTVELKTVQEKYVTQVTDDLGKVYINGKVIESTVEHPYYVVNKGWTKVKDLKVGDKVQTASGEYLNIEKIEIIENKGTLTVYNFKVEDNHNYYVGDYSVLVHNKGHSEAVTPI